jgi:hypothetical protein
MFGNGDTVNALLARGALVNPRNSNGMTPFGAAKEKKGVDAFSFESARLLRQHGGTQ